MKLRNLYIGLLALVVCGVAYGQNSYRSANPQLQLDVIHSDLEAFYISMDMDPRGNLYVGGRDAVYLFEADGQGGFEKRRTITTLPKDTWAYSLQVAGDDLYVLTVTALYRLPNVIRNPGKVSFERLVWGIPLGHIHQGFHGMRMGPDGCLYLAYGDPHPGPFRSRTNPGHVWHWTFLSGPKAKKFPWTGVGAVIRYDPRSHDLEVISRGFRNICDLDFDEYWNLFGNDNDQEGSALHSFGRLVHLTEGSHYQWSRGWLEAKEPYRNDLIETIDPRLGRFVPFGTCYYNEDHLGEAYKRSLFVARWGSRELGQFPLTPRGSSFVSAQKLLLTGKGTARPVAVFTGNDGRLFVSVCFMQRNEASPVRRTDLVAVSNPGRPWKSTAFDPAKADIARLLEEIESASWKRRFNAHREIISRGMRGDKQVRERFLDCKAGEPAWFSLAWLAGRNDDKAVAGALARALSSDNAQVVATAADTLHRFHQLNESQVKSLLSHQSPVVQLAGLRAADGFDLQESIAALAQSGDSLVRQAAQRWLGRQMTWSKLDRQFRTGDLPARRVALAAAMWKWNDTVENGTIPSAVRLSPAAKRHLSGFGYVDDPKLNLQTESKKHGFAVGGLSLKDWWKQTASSDPAAPVIQRMIAQSIDDADDAHRKTAAVFANTLGLDDLAARVPSLAQTRKIKANLAKGAKLSANKAMPPAYQAIDWRSAWKTGDATTGHTLFQQRCVACHDSGKGGGIIGPSLAGVAKRFTPQYLAESVVVPSKDISPNFQTWAITQTNNKEWLGFLSGEDQNRVTLQMMDGSLKAIEKSTIKGKKASATSLMPVGLIMSPDELKHIVKFLMKPEPGFKSIFNGKDLTGWEGDDKAWSVVDGAIQSTGGQTKKNWLIWRGGKLSDFELRLSFKFTKGNSGVQVRSKEIAKWQVRGYQVEIADATKMGLWHHSLAPEKHRSHLATAGQRVHIGADGKKKIEQLAEPAKVQSVCRDNEWNELVIKAVGSRLVQKINGVVFAELVDEEAKYAAQSGLLALQDHGKGCVAAFKNIRIKHLRAEGRTKRTDRPNILLILIDDMSWSGPGCYGNQLVDTPNIDRLASRGMKFTSAYVTPSCSPTRTELLSGKHSARMHITRALPGLPAGYPWARHKGPILSRGIPFSARTLAEALKDQGYRTAHLGKWHVGMSYTAQKPKQMEKVRSEFGFDHTFHGFSSFHRDKSVTALTDEAIRFLEKDDEKPFFVYLAHQTVHTHCAAPGDVVKQYLTEKRKPSGGFPHEGINNATYLAMIKHLDNETGRLLKALEETALDKNTIVVFLSDNGGNTRVTTNGPLRRGKCTSYEGGIRVPMLVSWPGVIRAGSVCDQAVHASLDLYPTLLDAAGGQKKKGQVLDGRGLMPLLKENGIVDRKALFWHAPHYLAQPGNHFRVTPHSAVRKGDFKLIEFFHDHFEYDEPARTAIRKAADDYAPYPLDGARYVPKARIELFNIKKDIGEQNDLSVEMPGKVAELKALLVHWRKSVGAQMPVKNPRFNPEFKKPRKK